METKALIQFRFHLQGGIYIDRWFTHWNRIATYFSDDFMSAVSKIEIIKSEK